MTNSEIVSKLSEDKVIETIATNIRVDKSLRDDFIQEINMILLEYDNVKLNDIYEKNQLNFFVTRICINNWHSTTSPFYTKYRKEEAKLDKNADLIKLSDII